MGAERLYMKAILTSVIGILTLGLAACADFEDAPTAAPRSVSESP